MSINTFVWDYSFESAKIIEALRENETITLKFWGLRFPHRHNKKIVDKERLLNRFDRNAFHSLEWIKKYQEEVDKYTDAVEFNQEVYDKVYQKLYLFIDHYSRHDKRDQKQSVHYYINQFNLLYSFFYGVFVKEQIQLVVMGGIPHLGDDLMIYEIAKALNLKIILVSGIFVRFRWNYLESLEDHGDFHFMAGRPSEDVPEIKLEKKFFIDHYYMRNLKKYNFSLLGAVVRAMGRPHQFFEYLAYNYLRYLRFKRYQKNLSSIISPVDYNKKYVYFPLHLQPEATTSALGGVFCDQVLALELLSKKLPKDWVIYVKENPIQTEFMRDDAFFTRLKLIDNLQMTPLDENTFKLIEHSQFVATITGTAGWEAVCGGKPALIFGRAWYQNFEGAFKWHNDIELQEIASYQVDHAKLEKDYNHFVSKLSAGLVVQENADEVTGVDSINDKNCQSIIEDLRKMIEEVKNEVISLPYQTLKKSA